ncbi:MAG: signal peptidase I [Lachnospiraceae bacterium]|nr:signal peptidase I [Lachnospiraceae bacterium]
MRKRREGLTFYEKKQIVSRELVMEILSWLFYTVITVLIAWLLVWGFGFRIHMVGSAMLPDIRPGQSVFIDRVLYHLRQPSRGDLVAFYPNGNENAHIMIRRVVALPGETVRIEDGILYIDDRPEGDSGRHYDRIADAGIAVNSITLGNKEYFVLGDLRNASEDSRSAGIGPVTSAMLVGKAWFWVGDDDK